MDLIKRIGANAALVLASLLVSLLVLELVLHLVPQRLMFLPPLEPKGYVSHDPELGFDITPNVASTTHVFYDLSYTVSSNELGCFDAPFNNESPYIYMTGDSFTWGWTPLEDKWGKRVEALSGVRTLTCGVNAYGTRQELVKTSRDLARLPKPELLVVGYFGANDLDDDENFPQITVYKGSRISTPTRCAGGGLISSSSPCEVPRIESLPMLKEVQFFLSRYSVLYNLGRYFANVEHFARGVIIAVFPDAWLERAGIVHFVVAPTLNEENDSYVEHLASVRAFKTLAQSYKVPLLFVLIPAKEMARATSTDPTWPNERIKEYLDKEGIAYLDLLPSLRPYEALGNSLYWDFDGHLNPRGNRLAGLIVARYGIEEGLIPAQNKAESLRVIEQELQTFLP